MSRVRIGHIRDALKRKWIVERVTPGPESETYYRAVRLWGMFPGMIGYESPDLELVRTWVREYRNPNE